MRHLQGPLSSLCKRYGFVYHLQTSHWIFHTLQLPYTGSCHPTWIWTGKMHFFTELDSLLEMIAKYNCNVLILGDINIHLDELNNADTKHLNKRFLLHGLEQLVHVPTPRRNLRCHHCSLSKLTHIHYQHCSLILFRPLNDSLPRTPWTLTCSFKTIKRRSFTHFDASSFGNDLLYSQLSHFSPCYTSSNRSADDLFSLYDSTMESHLNKHKPIEKQRFERKMTAHSVTKRAWPPNTRLVVSSAVFCWINLITNEENSGVLLLKHKDIFSNTSVPVISI